MDIPVDFLLEKLTRLVVYHVKLIADAKNDLDQLNIELRSLKAVLKDASKKSKKEEVFKEWERQIREAVYDIEDAIDTCITEMAAEKAKPLIKRTAGKLVKRISLAKLVRSLREDKVKPLIQESTIKLANLVISDIPDTTVLATRDIRQKRRQSKIVGVEDETATLIKAINERSDKLEVISIIGMPGLGKTTVAWKIYQDPLIKFEFSTLIWVNVSEELNVMNVLRTILKEFTSNIPNDISKEKLVEEVKTKLTESGKFLIVMDDVWTKNAWDELNSFLPKSNNMGRVLITSREEKVAYHANPKGKPHKLRFLTPEESWELLQYEVYDDVTSVHTDLVQAGQVIAKQCDGLPLSIIVIGGILKDKISEVRGVSTSLKDEWDKVSRSIDTYLVYGDKEKRLERIINLSYANLPYEVRDCFLYLGVFPEDVDIPVKKLTLLWIAEGFIQKIPMKSEEEVALENLMELINRNLIMVEEAKPDGEAKICRVHDSIRQFCRTEAKFENFNLFQEISKNQGVFEPSLDSVHKYRRLCIHSNVQEFFMALPKKKVQKARTFLCSPQETIDLATKDIAPVTGAFRLLRVLDAEKLTFPKFPPKLLTLIHLRYLTLAFTNDQNNLPEDMSSLWNLQTLIVDTPSKTLQVKVDIWVMRHLRHFKSKQAIVLRVEGEGEGGENLQTLSHLSPASCTDNVFDKAKNLVMLGIQGELSFLLESNCLEKLERLNKLKLVHQGAPLRRLPEQNSFPPNLKILVLAKTFLSWEHMSVLARLHFLKVLKLKDHAFTGNSWTVAAGEFQHLTLLDMERLNVMFWTTSADSFKNLGLLLLKNCENLKEVPFEVGKNLEMLYLERVTQSAVTSAVKIKKARQAEGAKGKEFVLNVAPGDTIQTS